MVTVMIADDSRYLRLLIKTVVKKMGYQVIAEADTGKDAINLYKQFKPDLITMDVVMPKLNGLQAIKAIKPMNPDVKIIVVTALGHEPLVNQALKLGANDCIVKPFSTEQLVNTIERVMK